MVLLIMWLPDVCLQGVGRALEGFAPNPSLTLLSNDSGLGLSGLDLQFPDELRET